MQLHGSFELPPSPPLHSLWIIGKRQQFTTQGTCSCPGGSNACTHTRRSALCWSCVLPVYWNAYLEGRRSEQTSADGQSVAKPLVAFVATESQQTSATTWCSRHTDFQGSYGGAIHVIPEGHFTRGRCRPRLHRWFQYGNVSIDTRWARLYIHVGAAW